MTRILAIDPGTLRSGWMLYDTKTERPVEFGRWDNEALIVDLRSHAKPCDVAVIEKVESFGMAVGKEVFATVWWYGRFTEALHPTPVILISRKRVAGTICGNARANDSNIRTALLDRFGGSDAKGTKKNPGPLYGVANDVWSSLALAVTLAEIGWTSPLRETP
jgi:hypothetical protein